MRRKNRARPDGNIPVEVYLGRDPKTKKRIRKTVYGKTQKEADEKADILKLKYHRGIDVTGKDTFGEWAERWAASRGGSPGRQKIRRYEIDKLAPLYFMAITKIRPADVQDIVDRYAKCNPRTGAPSAKKTLRDLRSAAHQIFQLAIVNRVLDWNPVDVVTIPKSAPQMILEPVSLGIVSLIENTPHRAQTAAMIMLHAGLRRGELLALDWKNVNLKLGIIFVKESVEMYDGKGKIKEGGKTLCATRAVYIPERLVSYLQVIWEHHVIPLQGPDLVFPAARGGVYGSSSWGRLWKNYMEVLSAAAGKGISFTAQQLRHTFATSLYLAGVDVKTAQDQLGHAKLETTLEIYTQLDRKYKRRSMKKLDAYYSGSVPVSPLEKPHSSAGPQ